MLKKPGSNLQKAIIAGSSMTGYLLTFGIIGYFLSKQLDNQVFFIFFLITGTFLGLYELFKQIKK
tara:strand:+ start:148 stop:342 length:195 start_codon:yes stop_codon:yes gene_type:complete